MRKGSREDVRRGRLWSPFGIAQIVTLLLIASACWLAYNPWRWGRLKDEAHARFPTMWRITGEELDSWLQGHERQPVILDARSEAEHAFSHLPGARRSNLTPSQLGIEGDPNAPIVVYCAVGLEAPAVAMRFLALGYTHVQYLEGGIYLWANEGRPMENIRGGADKVLPADSKYTSYLDRSRRGVVSNQ